MLQSFIYKKKGNPFTYFLLKLLLLAIIVFALDFSIGSILRYYYFKQKSGFLYRTTFSVDKTKADLLVFGSSRASRHYFPDYFENNLQLSYYNTGRDGNFILYQYAMLKAVLKRYTPKIILLDFVKGEFAINQNDYDRLSALLPYYNSHPEMQSVILLKSAQERIKLLSAIYPYNSAIFSIAIGNADFNKGRSIDNKGYVAIATNWKEPIPADVKLQNYQLDFTKIKLYELFIKDCKKLKIKLFIVCSPYLIKYANSDNSVTMAREIAAKNKVPFVDFSQNSLFINHAKLFADTIHLNDEGAQLFSSLLIQQMALLKE